MRNGTRRTISRSNLLIGSKLSVSEKTRLKGLQIKTVLKASDKNYSRADNMQKQ